MKKSVLFTLAIALSGCVSTTRITGSWVRPDKSGHTYESIFVASLTANTVIRSVTETDLANALNNTGVATVKSIDEFPPNLKRDTIPEKELLSRVKNKKSDAILTISLLKKTTESRYVRGDHPYAPIGRYPYYGSFWGYYSYWYPYTYSPGYYTEEDIYYLETNLYDAGTEALVWSAQSQTYSYNGIAPVSKEFARVIVEKLAGDGIIKRNKK